MTAIVSAVLPVTEAKNQRTFHSLQTNLLFHEITKNKHIDKLEQQPRTSKGRHDKHIY